MKPVSLKGPAVGSAHSAFVDSADRIATYCLCAVIALVPLVPWVTVTLDGDAERLKFGCAPEFTVRPTVVGCDTPPDVPVIVIV